MQSNSLSNFLRERKTVFVPDEILQKLADNLFIGKSEIRMGEEIHNLEDEGWSKKDGGSRMKDEVWSLEFGVWSLNKCLF